MLSQNGNTPPDKRLYRSTPVLHMSEAAEAASQFRTFHKENYIH